jgi:YidC/Oxa1 family membrane protein insertase
MITLWNILIYKPLYNALVAVIDILPGANIALAVIILTVVVKALMLPLNKKSIKSQMAMKEIEPELNKIKKDYPDKQIQAQKTMALYKERGVNPFSGCLVILIQFPIIIALYLIFTKGINGGIIDPSLLYSFVKMPTEVGLNFLGAQITEKNLIIAILVAASQYFSLKQINDINKPKKEAIIDPNEKADFAQEFSKNMTKNMTYTLPIIIGIVSYQVSAAVALYFLTSNVVSIVQQTLILRKKNAQK